MLLNFQYHQVSQSNKKTPLVLIHGLFGSLSNLGVIARAFNDSHDIVQIDVRNHGHSPHSNEMNYQFMAQDVLETMRNLNIDQFTVIGHSMGGKIAMKLAEVARQQIEQLVVLDMAPFAYQENHHDVIFKALFAVEQAQITTRKEAIEIMRQYIREEMVIQFLLMSFKQGKWLFNLHSISEHYHDILNWDNIISWSKPALFIRGADSGYIAKEQHITALEQQFPYYQLETIEGAGHWLHAQKPDQVIEKIKNYLN
nr:alpha/beta fold hydrolase [Acinetobacter sp. Marseille-Q1620]